MAVRFHRKRNRLHVGFRAEDWSEVWMELKLPEGEDRDVDEGGNRDGEFDFDLYKFSTGGKVRREPMMGEVKWLPHFDPKNCESASAAERKKLHRRFLTDAHTYLAARDVKHVKKLESEFDRPRSPRWQSWFDLAKKFKRTQMQNLANGHQDDSDDDDDSAYDSEADRNASNMSPPRTPASLTKRKASGKSTNRGESGSKKKKLSRGGQTRINFHSGRTFNMSGGLGSRSTVSGDTNRDNDSDDEPYDTRPPEDLPNDMIDAHNLGDIGSPSGSRHRGNSRENSIPLFRDWVRNERMREETPPDEPNRGNQDMDDRRRMEEFNGDFDEDEAWQAAREASMAWKQ